MEEGGEVMMMRMQDLWAVYHGKLGFLKTVDERTIHVRTSTETRTFQVAGGLLYGMDRSIAHRPFKVHTQPDNVGIPSSRQWTSRLMRVHRADRLARAKLRVPGGRRNPGRLPGGSGLDGPSRRQRGPDGQAVCAHGRPGPARVVELVYAFVDL
jgi:hypothetical protein